jgi:hypothetical protein
MAAARDFGNIFNSNGVLMIDVPVGQRREDLQFQQASKVFPGKAAMGI